ncbi:putative reverse transcriptase zinc-binding domain-containing protein [Helianthus anomalus]
MVRLSNDRDSWVWNIDIHDGFSDNLVKKTLISDRGSGYLPDFKWCKWVPIKCNIMAWRGNLDRLATRVNLRRRNVEIASVICPFCDKYEESVDHLFTACSMAMRVWTAINVWGKKAKKIISWLVIISCWCIWKSRNELAFKQIRRSTQDILLEIKSRGFEWLNYRSSCKYLS